LAGLIEAQKCGYVEADDITILDSTAHALKFIGFQQMYFEDQFPPEFNIKPKAEFINAPITIKPENLKKAPAPGKPLKGDDFNTFVKEVSEEIAASLNLKK
jgi:threonine synthase